MEWGITAKGSSGGQSSTSRLTGRLQTPARAMAAVHGVLSNPQEWVGVVLIFLSLAIVMLSIEHANWIKPQPSLVLVLGLSVLVGLWFGRIRLSGKLAYPIVVLLGVGITVWQSVGLVSPTGAESSLTTWWHTVTGSQPNEGTIYFAMFIIMVTWLMGYISTWFLVCRQNVWVAIIAGTVTILFNLSNLPPESHYFLPIYLLVAMLLLGQVNLRKQGGWFQQHGLSFSRPGVIKVVGAVVVISILTVTVAWVVPEPPIEQMGLNLTAIHGETAQGQWFNIFADVRGKWPRLDSGTQAELLFASPWSTSSREQFVVTADEPTYWRIRRYDTYHSWGWTSSETVGREVDPLVAGATRDAADGEMVTYTVENMLRTDVLLVTGEFDSASITALLHTFSAVEDDEGVVAVVSPKMMKPYQQYTVTACINVPTVEELSQAGEDYPQGVIEHYLQLPDTLPEQVVSLSQEITAEAETALDKVRAVKAYLRDFEYNLKAERPTEDVDGVAYFLFETGEGVCTTFASAMAVMLRSAGVPARLNTGYLEGVLDEDTGSYILRAKDYHARTEVYFPGYGWVEFSATPGGDGGAAEVAVVDNSESDIPPSELPPDGAETPDTSGVEGDTEPATTGRPRFPGPALYVYFIIIGIPLVLYLAARAGYAYWLARLKRVDNPADVYARMCYLASLIKVGPEFDETPLEYSTRLSLAMPANAGAIDTITRAYIETQFSSRKELSGLQKGRMQKSWVELCPSLVKRLLGFKKPSK
ncbi:MAG TPA: transglutaminase domain-containing protein [Dehalococcoidia bacterium]|nr:transglutaminase domain-containing protein [Dehalococcoidia bacterium]